MEAVLNIHELVFFRYSKTSDSFNLQKLSELVRTNFHKQELHTKNYRLHLIFQNLTGYVQHGLKVAHGILHEKNGSSSQEDRMMARRWTQKSVDVADEFWTK